MLGGGRGGLRGGGLAEDCQLWEGGCVGSCFLGEKGTGPVQGKLERTNNHTV